MDFTISVILKRDLEDDFSNAIALSEEGDCLEDALKKIVVKNLTELLEDEYDICNISVHIESKKTRQNLNEIYEQIDYLKKILLNDEDNITKETKEYTLNRLESLIKYCEKFDLDFIIVNYIFEDKNKSINIPKDVYNYILECYNDNKKIAAIKKLREHKDLTLKEAKVIMDSIFEDLRLPF